MQLRNLIKHYNVGNKPKNCFNACDNFFMLVFTAYILSMAMHFLGMDSIDQDPNPSIIPSEVQQLGKKDRKKVLDDVTSLTVNSYNKTITCKPSDSCSSTEAAGDDKEVPINTSKCSSSDSENEDESPDTPTQSICNDDVQRYVKELMSLGLIYSELSDGIREGAGPRIFRCFKYMLPLFKVSDRVNYSSEIFCVCLIDNESYQYFLINITDQHFSIFYSIAIAPG